MRPKSVGPRTVLGKGALLEVAAQIEPVSSSAGSKQGSEAAAARQAQIDTVASLIFAGHDTTSNTLSWCCYELARNPNVQRKLQVGW
eukprot:SAG11_NODE_28303_length_323_cov_0.696429_1_plen_86_part_10